MSDCYVYDAFEDNLYTAGIVGALTPTVCEYSPAAGTVGEITMEHPYDKYGKWRALVVGNILKAWVPMPTLPIISENKTLTTVRTYTVNDVEVSERFMYCDAVSNKKKHLLTVGEKVIGMEETSSGRKKVMTSRCGSGWVKETALRNGSMENLQNTANGIEQIAPSVFVRPQFFEIRSVQQKDEGIIVTGMQIASELLKNITSYAATGEINHQTALDGILNNCKGKHSFKGYTDINTLRSDLSWHLINPIKAMLDPEEGAAAKWKSQFVADDYDLYFLKRAGSDRGMRIEYGKNLTGIDCKVDMSNLATRIIPVGENEDGSDLYLDGDPWIDSKNIGAYPYPHIYVLECDGCKVGNDGVTVDIARARMREQAQKLLDDGCDIPEISLSIEYSSLGDTEEYKQYRYLERVYLYDIVHIRNKKIGISADLEAVEMTWDCIKDRPVHMQFGTLRTTAAKIASWQIPSGISGTKLIAGSVGSGQLGNDIINARHIQAESINAEALNAKTVTAYIISAVQAKIGEIVAGKITADELFAAILGAVKLSAETGKFTFAEIKNLLAETMFVTQGVGDKIQIANLSVTEANIVSLSVGDLLIRNENGEMVRLYVDAEGNVQTGDPIEDGTLSGTKLIDGSITTAQLNAEEIFANNGTIMNLIAGNITANTAVIDSIVTTTIGSISGMLELYVLRENLETYLRLLTDGVHVGQSGNSSEVVVTPATVDVRLNGSTYSQFASNYVQFGNYQLRRSADGGLVFKLKEV